jgi:membrane-anchored glycerophosphoryl diester phosphodiesterase (GDPDase)
MDKKYEFSHQTTKQKAILISVKIFVLLLLAGAIYSLGGEPETLQERISAIGRILILHIPAIVNTQSVSS